MGREGLEDRERMAPEKTSAQDSLEKELCGGQERGQGRTLIGKCRELVFVPLTSVPKDENGGSH